MLEHEIKILLVDDDDVDVAVVKRAFKRQGITNELFVAHDGVEALAMLRGEDGYEQICMPVLVLLDLNMPRMGGHEFLSELRSDVDLHRTIVFVLTTSNDQRDRDAAYDKHIAGYLVKSQAGKQLVKEIPLIENYLANVQFPVKSNGTRSMQSFAGNA